ncbi:glycerophosphodiester phosphodiesterase family protein [Streptosporangium sp. 'caverna']|uniref:glycerophosphodiester phosphodiesterase family protein n=1 Tax=Streptosporangium sp. 'caverna' TaxID=2202249 RepID=UPI000D7D3BB5|nr:glycerophosphodiester phosphodiesterase family protein [Streptosporangium sp. 'caverna']AWS40504.1 glycerophosphodiester phosphodiesterase [Streptosporangium sp. 'caverna']
MALPRAGQASAAGLSREGRAAERLKNRRVKDTPIVIAHRGASAFRPEHTLLAYRAAIRMGADYLELDLVSTKDHVLVARHENEISQTTDVAKHPEFAARKTTKTINGHKWTGWFVEDFTLAELRTLRARERLPKRRPGNVAYDGKALIPTLDEIAKLAQKRDVGLYAEIKHPGYSASIGLPLEAPMLKTFKQYGWDDAKDPVFIQSFEADRLKALRPFTRLRLIQLVGAPRTPSGQIRLDCTPIPNALFTPEGLRQLAQYADGIGVTTTWIVPAGPGGKLGSPTSLVQDAHRAGLLVHAATVRDENSELPAPYRRGDPGDPAYQRSKGDAAGWLERLYGLGVDGVFADDPGIARVTRDRLLAGADRRRRA